MVRSRNHFVWVLATLAALVAPALPQTCGCPCDESASICPQPCCGAETPTEACRCQLHARHDQPLLPAKSASPSLDNHDQAVAPTALAMEVPQVLGVSREYLSSSLAVPIRPPRILFGVWRN